MNEPIEYKRIAAIVGRPNVGKSALFNRLIGRRLSIVHEESGVTRDRVAAEASWNHQLFELIDTGGLGLMDGQATDNIFDEEIRNQVTLAIQDAAVLILVVDLEAGITPLDQEVGRLMHTTGRPVFLAANKADTVTRDALAMEFEPLGFPVFPVSALHNRGFDDLMEPVLKALPPGEPVSDREPLKVAVVGKPNAGKSSYINRLLRSERVMVSDIPGTTRDSVEVPFKVGVGDQARHYTLIDTAGMRRKRKIQDAVEKFSIIRTEKSIELADVVVHVVDSSAGFGTHDKKIAALINKHETGCLLLLNKWDLSEVTQTAFGKELLRDVPFLSHVPILFASAADGYNIRKSVEAVDHVAAQVTMQLATGVLNRVLHQAFEKKPPPVAGSKRVRFFYATQVGTQPLRVRMFVSNPKYLNSNYKTYLLNNLRKAFGLEGAPLKLHFSARRREDRPEQDERRPEKKRARRTAKPKRTARRAARR